MFTINRDIVTICICRVQSVVNVLQALYNFFEIEDNTTTFPEYIIRENNNELTFKRLKRIYTTFNFNYELLDEQLFHSHLSEIKKF